MRKPLTWENGFLWWLARGMPRANHETQCKRPPFLPMGISIIWISIPKIWLIITSGRSWTCCRRVFGHSQSVSVAGSIQPQSPQVPGNSLLSENLWSLGWVSAVTAATFSIKLSMSEVWASNQFPYPIKLTTFFLAILASSKIFGRFISLRSRR